MQALCTVCGCEGLVKNLSFGRQPLSTCFRKLPVSNLTESELSVGFCRFCATIQLVDRFPLSLLQNKYPPGQFREPFAHLPAIVDKLVELGAVRADSNILGLSYIDASLLDLLADRGYGSGQIVDFAQLIPWQENFGLETMQSVVSTPGFALRVGKMYGKFDLVCARFMLEHAESAHAFLRALLELVRPGGHLLVEVPDVGKMLACGNHALVWEDHFTYFSSSSLLRLVDRVGALPMDLSSYSYAYENAIVAILRVDDSRSPSPSFADQVEVESVTKALKKFAEEFEIRKAKFRKKLEQLISAGERLALFGAGHHSAKYLNFYGFTDLIDFVIDDNPTKKSLYMPGTDIVIKDSRFLMESELTTCLSSLNPESDVKVRQALAPFFDRGGQFIPIFEQNGAKNDS